MISIIIMIFVIIIKLTHSKAMQKNSLRIMPQPEVLDFENLS